MKFLVLQNIANDSLFCRCKVGKYGALDIEKFNLLVKTPEFAEFDCDQQEVIVASAAETAASSTAGDKSIVGNSKSAAVAKEAVMGKEDGRVGEEEEVLHDNEPSLPYIGEPLQLTMKAGVSIWYIELLLYLLHCYECFVWKHFFSGCCCTSS